MCLLPASGSSSASSVRTSVPHLCCLSPAGCVQLCPLHSARTHQGAAPPPPPASASGPEICFLRRCPESQVAQPKLQGTSTEQGETGIRRSRQLHSSHSSPSPDRSEAQRLHLDCPGTSAPLWPAHTATIFIRFSDFKAFSLILATLGLLVLVFLSREPKL